jgi:ABC-type multidrug transport system fused ATPase/permease subunit
MREVWKVFRQGLTLLSASGKRVLYIYGLGLILLSGLDGIALYFVSKVFTASGGGESIEISSGGPTLLLVVALFTLRTVFSTLLSWVSVKKFALEEVRVGSSNFDSLMSDTWNNRIDSPVTDLYNSVDRGPNNLVQGLLIGVVTIIAESATAVLILAALMLLQPVTAIIAAVYFSLVAIAQHRLLSHSSSRAGESVVTHTNGVYATLTDAFSLSKLLTINPSQSLRPHLHSQRESLALARGRVIFLGMLPRYFMELILAIGLALIAGGTYALSGPESAVAAVTVFAAAGFRLLPIVNRIQGLVLQLFSTVPGARLAFIPHSKNTAERPSSTLVKDVELRLQEVSFQYPTADRPALVSINLEFQHGLQYAIVGPSGAGKTTLVDICLGLLQPQGGTVACNSDAKISYVPQETHIARLSLEQNIALEWDSNNIDPMLVKKATDSARLANVLDGRESTSELSGQALSGGQKQRIGLARAIYRNPSLLFLDEVTSALDAETEHAVMSSIEQLRGSITVVIVAHRLSTVQHADQVVYIEDGKVVGMGTFEELRKSIPQLQRQIELGTLDLLS